MKNPTISVITPSFNQGAYIRDSIESVINQNYENIEHIIVDGGSTDETISILKEYKHLVWISEKDSGPVDAIQKGIKMSKGKIIAWLNSDDYYETNVFKEIADSFKNNDVQILVGNMLYVNRSKEILFESDYSEIYNLDHLIRVNPDIITQPSTFFTRNLFEMTGGFNTNLKLVWDYDLFIKMFKIQKPYFLDRTISSQRIYDETLTRKFARKQACELYRISKCYGARINDPIMKLILKRMIFPGIVKSKPSLALRTYWKIKSIFYS